MKIAAADVAFSTHHSVVLQHKRRESLVEGVAQDGVWDPARLTDATTVVHAEEQAAAFTRDPTLLNRHLAGRSPEELTAQNQSRTATPSLRAALSQEHLVDLDLLVQQTTNPLPGLFSQQPVREILPFGREIDSLDRAKIQLLVATIEHLSNEQFKLFAPDTLELSTKDTAVLESFQKPPVEEGQAQQPAWGLRYEYSESHYEAETSSFHTDGLVRTQDGREIEIEVDLTMSRQFASETNIEVNLGAALQDPLVINFTGTAAELSQTKFSFDLDSDGAEDQIHFVGPNSGFLAIDQNANGRIDDGGELFGPTSGNGFAELATHDEDGNQWIDENDSIYSGLRIWSKDNQGNDQLVALGQRGIGAIYLGHAATPFAVKDEQNQLQATVRSSGIYLNEDGSAGTVQQLDLVV